MTIWRSGLAAMLAGAALLGAEAQACSILAPMPPPAVVMIPGEEQADYDARAKLHVDGFMALQAQDVRQRELKRQTDLWAASSAVAVVEIVSIKRDVPIGTPPNVFGNGNAVKVKAVSWLKGKSGGVKSLQLAHTAATSCGPVPMWRVMYGEPGQRYVMFFDTGKPSQATGWEGMEATSITAPEIIAALAGKVR